MRRASLARTLTALVAVAALAGCGGGGRTSTTTTQAPGPKLLRGPHSCEPPEGQGTTGSCTPRPKLGAGHRTLSGPFFVDVSYFQGTINWRAAKPYISGAVVRVGDGNFNDPAFARNWHALRALGIWHAAYFFLRPGNCAGEAQHAVALVNAQGGLQGPLVADAEVPLNYGCAAAFVATVKRLTGKPEVIYTAPGTWAGGPHGGAVLWVASYGPSPGCVWTCSHVGWQYTDGSLGPSPHCTPGIGCDDRSTDNGMTKLGSSPANDKAAKRRALRRHLAAIKVLHALIERHKCRPGQHATPKTYHRVCGHWLAEGEREHRLAKRLEKELR